MMAISGLVADSGHALWTDRMQVALVQREVCTAKPAPGGPLLSRATTRRAPDYRRIVSFGLRHLYEPPAEAAEERANSQLRGIVLSLTGGTGYQQSHRDRMLHRAGPVNRAFRNLQPCIPKSGPCPERR